MMQTTVNDCKIVGLDRHHSDRQGDFCVVGDGTFPPFEVKRVFYIYDIPGGECRGAHAHCSCHQFIIAASGSFEVTLDDGFAQKIVSLNRPYVGLHIPPGIWAAEQNFSSGSVCLVLTSEKYDKEDYIREYEEFLIYKNENGTVKV